MIHQEHVVFYFEKKPLRICYGGSEAPQLWQSRNAVQPQLVEAHTLTYIETYRLTRMW